MPRRLQASPLGEAGNRILSLSKPDNSHGLSDSFDALLILKILKSEKR